MQNKQEIVRNYAADASFVSLSPFVFVYRVCAPVCAALLGVTLAFAAVIRTTHTTKNGDIDFYATGQMVKLFGVIAEEPDRRPLQTKYTIAVSSIETESKMLHTGIRGRVLVSDHHTWPEFQFGDSVVIEGKLEKPERIEAFHYDRYLSRYNIYAVIYRASIDHEPIPSSPAPYIPTSLIRTRKTLYSLKESFEHRINLLLPEPHASFMAGLLTGSRRGIPEHLLENFRRTGLTHIIAISGYNITLVIAVISSLLIWLPFRARFFPACLAIILFTIFVGAHAAVVRAAIMGILGLIALHTHRSNHARLALLWSAFFMLCWNPKLLWYDVGFQLSFLAVLGLIELSPLLEPHFKRIPETLALRESLLMTLSAQLTAVPIIVFHFSAFSLVAPLANILIAPAIPLAMLLGFLSVCFSLIAFPLGQLLAYGSFFALEWIISIANILGSLPFASLNIEVHYIVLIMYYATIGLIMLQYNHIVAKRGSRGTRAGATPL